MWLLHYSCSISFSNRIESGVSVISVVLFTGRKNTLPFLSKNETFYFSITNSMSIIILCRYAEKRKLYFEHNLLYYLSFARNVYCVPRKPFFIHWLNIDIRSQMRTWSWLSTIKWTWLSLTGFINVFGSYKNDNDFWSLRVTCDAYFGCGKLSCFFWQGQTHCLLCSTPTEPDLPLWKSSMI